MSLPIAYGNTETLFADGEFTVTAGAPATLFITNTGSAGIPSGVQFPVALKTAAGGYTVMWVLDSTNCLELGTILPPATYAVRRLASTHSAGLELKA